MIPNSYPICDWHINSRWPNAPELLGPIPTYLSPKIADPAWMQFRDHAELGWNPEPSGWWMLADHYLQQGTDRPLEPVAFTALHDEGVYVYLAGYVCVVRASGEFTVAKVFS
jgi:hypothetical protein